MRVSAERERESWAVAQQPAWVETHGNMAIPQGTFTISFSQLHTATVSWWTVLDVQHCMGTQAVSPCSLDCHMYKQITGVGGIMLQVCNRVTITKKTTQPTLQSLRTSHLLQYQKRPVDGGGALVHVSNTGTPF